GVGAETGAIDSRQLGGGLADYAADAREGAADNERGVAGELRRASGATRSAAGGTARERRANVAPGAHAAASSWRAPPAPAAKSSRVHARSESPSMMTTAAMNTAVIAASMRSFQMSRANSAAR